jgi:cobalamin biosynthetic protein CobC
MTRDHGGGIDRAVTLWGGARDGWLDLSTGINPIPYPVGDIPQQAWTALPDQGAAEQLIATARAFWSVPAHLDILPAPGASALIARMPILSDGAQVHIPTPTYNEHAAAFRLAGWTVVDTATHPTARVIVHPNNPDGRLWSPSDLLADGLTVVDESFCDVTPDQTLIDAVTTPHQIILKSFGKFWGLAGVRLGFAIGAPQTLHPMRDAMGPWAVSGPAQTIATRALNDTGWATATRARLATDADRMDQIMRRAGHAVIGGTTLFRLYDTPDAPQMQDHLGQHHILCRIFPYSKTWVRLGLPGTDAEWDRLEQALA